MITENKGITPAFIAKRVARAGKEGGKESAQAATLDAAAMLDRMAALGQTVISHHFDAFGQVIGRRD